MTRQACLGREGGLSDLTLGPYATPSGGPVGIQLSGPLNWKGRRKPGDRDTWNLCPGSGREKEGCGSTWSLAAFLGQGRERKYVKRVAPGLAIWAEMPAARVGVWKEEPGLGPGSWIPVFPRVRALSFGGSRPGEEAQDTHGPGNLGGKQVSAAMFGTNPDPYVRLQASRSLPWLYFPSAGSDATLCWVGGVLRPSRTGELMPDLACNALVRHATVLWGLSIPGFIIYSEGSF